MKILSLVPVITIGSLITVLAAFSPMKKAFSPSTEVEMTEEMKKTEFKHFLNNFEEVALPYSIDQSTFADYNDNRKNKSSLYNAENRITLDYKAFVPGLESRFSRMGPNVYLYEAILEKSKDFATVIYSSHSPYRDYPKYLLVSYTAKGELLSTTVFAHRSYDKLTIGNINTKKDITIKTYTFDYEDEEIEYEKAIADNKLELKNVSTLRVNKKGKLEDTSTASIDNTDDSEDRAK